MSGQVTWMEKKDQARHESNIRMLELMIMTRQSRYHIPTCVAPDRE